MHPNPASGTSRTAELARRAAPPLLLVLLPLLLLLLLHSGSHDPAAGERQLCHACSDVWLLNGAACHSYPAVPPLR